MQDASLAIVFKNYPETRVNPSVLLVKRKDVPVWVLPGGGIELCETPEQAAIRETFEETGLQVEIVQHVATLSPLSRLAATIYLYSCRPIGPEEPIITKENEEVMAAEYFPIYNLPTTLFPVHRSFLLEWIEAKSLPIIRPLTEVTYFSILKLALRHPVLVATYLFKKWG